MILLIILFILFMFILWIWINFGGAPPVDYTNYDNPVKRDQWGHEIDDDSY